MRSVEKDISRFSRNVCGVKVSVVTIEDIFNLFSSSIRNDDKIILASLNMHGLYVHSKSEPFRLLHNLSNAVVHIDGMPIVWLCNFINVVGNIVRTGWIDWVYDFFQNAQDNQWKVYYVGSEEHVMQEAINVLRRRYPNLIIEGTNGFFDKITDGDENCNVLKKIDAFNPDVLIVGMGMGIQEEWIYNNLQNLNVNVIATCGACMEIVGGYLDTPPLFIRKLGIEWIYRLFTTPSRVWKRYIIEPLYVVKYLISRRKA